MHDARLYFAYGSNINLTQMEYRCPDAVPMGVVELKDYALTFRGGGVATIIPEKGSIVPGLLWSITPECEKSLDRYEGFPNCYHKDMVTVTDTKTGKQFDVMAYVMDEKYREPVPPSIFYFAGIAEGYLQNGMDPAPLYRAKERTCRAAERSCQFQFKPVDLQKKPAQRAKSRKLKDLER